MPSFKNHNGFPGIPNVATFASQFERFSENIPLFEEQNLMLNGVTRDATGAALGGCSVYVFKADFLPQRPPAPEQRGSTERTGATYVWAGVSDGAGAYSAGPFSRASGPYFVVAWGPSGTQVGVTVQTLQPA